ncbi:hypothetical protein K438DRAFT_1829286 [Mycena galopus ATCC 62051]|nr:hypothetical protein K438DRAFT_1880542 [Mycena galopus ATCC 62051]KAF8193204.1 hypothetical protein K438DRAFT_1829286 [Mycena galopus ATCC 62051]
MAGKDLVVRSGTGSGKTTAMILPNLQSTASHPLRIITSHQKTKIYGCWHQCIVTINTNLTPTRTLCYVDSTLRKVTARRRMLCVRASWSR